MSFFDVSGVPPPPPRPPAPPQPEWAGPPRGVLPGISTQRAVVFKTDQVFLMAHPFHCYPNGIEFAFDLRLREPDDHQLDDPWHLEGPRGSRPVTDEFLRLGLLLSDGSRWTNLEGRRPWGSRPPEPPFVSFRGGGGGGDSFRARYWMWPLPPPGALRIVAEWPALGIEETSVDVDATELRERAADAEVIWPEQPDPQPDGTAS